MMVSDESLLQSFRLQLVSALTSAGVQHAAPDGPLHLLHLSSPSSSSLGPSAWKLSAFLHSSLLLSNLRELRLIPLTPSVTSFVCSDAASAPLPSTPSSSLTSTSLLHLVLLLLRASIQLEGAQLPQPFSSAFKKPTPSQPPPSSATQSSNAAASTSSSSPSLSSYPPLPSASSVSSASSSPSRSDPLTVLAPLFDVLFLLFRALITGTAAPAPLTSAASAGTSMDMADAPASSQPNAHVEEYTALLSSLLRDVLFSSPSTSAGAHVRHAMVVRFLRGLVDCPQPTAHSVHRRPPLPSSDPYSHDSRPGGASSSAVTLSSPSITAPSDRPDLLEAMDQLTASTTSASSLTSALSRSLAALPSSIASQFSASASVASTSERERLYDRLLVPSGVSSDDQHALVSLALDASRSGKITGAAGGSAAVVKKEKEEGEEDKAEGDKMAQRALDAAVASITMDVHAQYSRIIHSPPASSSSSSSSTSSAASPYTSPSSSVDRLCVLKLFFSVIRRPAVLQIRQTVALVQTVSHDLFLLLGYQPSTPPNAIHVPPLASVVFVTPTSSALATSTSAPFSSSSSSSSASSSTTQSGAVTLGPATLKEAVLCSMFLLFACGEEGAHRHQVKPTKNAAAAADSAYPSSSSSGLMPVIKKEEEKKEDKSVSDLVARGRTAAVAYAQLRAITAERNPGGRLSAYTSIRVAPSTATAPSTSSANTSSSSMSTSTSSPSSFYFPSMMPSSSSYLTSSSSSSSPYRPFSMAAAPSSPSMPPFLDSPPLSQRSVVRHPSASMSIDPSPSMSDEERKELEDLGDLRSALLHPDTDAARTTAERRAERERGAKKAVEEQRRREEEAAARDMEEHEGEDEDSNGDVDAAVDEDEADEDSDDDEEVDEEGAEPEELAGEGEVSVDEGDIDAELSEAYSPSPPLLETHAEGLAARAERKEESRGLEEELKATQPAEPIQSDAAAAPAVVAMEDVDCLTDEGHFTSVGHLFATVKDFLVRTQSGLPSLLLQLITQAYTALMLCNANTDSWEHEDAPTAPPSSSSSSPSNNDAVLDLAELSSPFFPDSRLTQHYLSTPAPSSTSSSSSAYLTSPYPPSHLLSSRYLLHTGLGLVLLLLKASRHASMVDGVAPSSSPLFHSHSWASLCCNLLYHFRRHVEVGRVVKKVLTALTGSDSARHTLTDAFTYEQDTQLLAALFFPTPPACLLSPPSPLLPSHLACLHPLLSTPPLLYTLRLKLLHVLHRFEQLAKRRPSQLFAFLRSRPPVLYLLWLVALWLVDEKDEVTGVMAWRLIALVSQHRWKEGAEPDTADDADDADDQHPQHADDDEDGDDDDDDDDDKPDKDAATTGLLVMMDTDKSKAATDGDGKAPATASVSPFLPLFQCIVQHSSILSSFHQHHLLSPPDSALRIHAQSFLFFMWTYSSAAVRSVLFNALAAWIPYLPLYGAQAQPTLDLLSSILTSSHLSPTLGPSPSELSSAVSTLLRSFSAQVDVVAGHPQTEFFGRLGRVLGQQREMVGMTEEAKAQHAQFEVYCASAPCHICHASIPLLPHPKEKPSSSSTSSAFPPSASAPAGSSSLAGGGGVVSLSLSTSSSWSSSSSCAADLRQYKLGELSSDSKYGVQHRAIKLLSSFIIPAMHLRITYPSTPSSSLRFVKSIHIYFNAHPATDLSSLPLPLSLTHHPRDKKPNPHWTLAKTVALTPTQKDAKISFALPLHCSFLLLHYASFHHPVEVKEAELLKCPRCHIDVNRGVCPQCRENAYQCFPSLHTRVLTDAGFLFLDEIEARLARGEQVLYACYAPHSRAPQVKGEDVLKGQLLYRSGDLFYPPPSDVPQTLIEVSSAHERQRWTEGNGAYGLGSSEVDISEGDDDVISEDHDDASEPRTRRPYSHHVSLLVTPDHDMYVQMGDLDCRGRGFNPHQVQPAKEGLTKPPPAMWIPPSKVKASQLLGAPHERASVRLLACASSGHTPAPEEAAQEVRAVKTQLGLTNNAQFDAFLELFGFWLGDGTMAYHRSGVSGAVRFEQVNQTGIAFLDAILPNTGLSARDVQRSSTRLQRADGMKKLVVTWDVVNHAWFTFFDEAFGLMYSKSHRYDRKAALAKQGNARPSNPSLSVTPSSATRSLHTSSESDTEEEETTTSSSPDDPSESEDEDEPLTSSEDDPDDPIQSVKWLPVWSVMHLSCQQLRQLIHGLYRAGGDLQCHRMLIHTSGVAFRDQLMQALLHCGYTAMPSLAYPAGTVRGYRWHDQKDDSTVYTIAEYEAVRPEHRHKYVEVRAHADCWAVRWAEPVQSGKGSCWPSVNRQQGIRDVPYSEAEHGRIWCVTVQHPDHLIIAQRALRDPNTGLVQQQSRPIVVGQCRQCRNINYDNLTGFLCNECGHCKYGAFSWSALAAPGLAVDRVKGEEECKGKILDLEEIGVQLEDVRRESEKGLKEVHRILHRCERGLALKVPVDAVSVATSEWLAELRAQPLSSSLFAFGPTASAISFPMPSSMPSSSSSLSSSTPFTSPLDVFLLSKQKKVYSDLSKTFRVFLNTKREIARYLSSDALDIDPSTQPAPPSPPTAVCFLCGRAAVGSLVRVLAELPPQLLRLWAKEGRVEEGGRCLRALERVMMEGQHWADESTRQSAAYLLALLCGDREMEAVPYLCDHLRPVLLHELQRPSPSSSSVLLYAVRFLQLLFISQCHSAEPSEALLETLSLCLRLLLEAVQRHDQPDIAQSIIAPLLHILYKAAQLPPLGPSSTAPSSSTASSSSSSRYPVVSQPSASPSFPSEMKSPFFAALSREGLTNFHMSPALSSSQPSSSSPSADPSSAGRSKAATASSTSSATRQLRSPAIGWSAPRSAVGASQRSLLSSPRPPALIHPSGGASDMLALLSASSPPAGSADASATSASSSPPPLQLSSPSLSKPDVAFTATQLSSVLSRMAVMLSSFFASTLHPSSSTLSSPFRHFSVWKDALLSSEPSLKELQLARRVVDQWRRKRTQQGQVKQLPTLRRLLFNPASREVRDVTARLLFLLTAAPAEESTPPTVEQPPHPMDVDSGGDKREAAPSRTPTSPSAPPRSLSLLRSTALLDSFMSILSSLTPSECLHSSHFFAVFAELLNSSPLPALNAARKRHCVVRGLLPILMRRLSLELLALQAREVVCSSSVLSHSLLHAPEVGEDPSFCLYGLSSLLVDVLSVAEVRRCFLRHRDHSSAILAHYLTMRGIVFARTRLTELTGTQLHSLVTLLFNAGDKRNAIRAYLAALSTSHASPSHSSPTPSPSSFLSKRLQLVICQQLLDIIHPPLPSKAYQVLLRKSPTQEEYIRGNMRRQPYSSSDFPGPLMRHIQDTICTDLKLTNEENMFELLVAGKIISMDLDITKVYERVWKPQVEQQQQAGANASAAADARERERDRERLREREHLRARERLLAPMADSSSLSHLHPDLMSDSEMSEDDPLLDPASPHPPPPTSLPPMTVIFRLTGLDGEATEPLVESLPDDSAEKVDVEEQFRECDVLQETVGGGREVDGGGGRGSGLAVLIGRLEELKDLSHDVDYKLAQELLKVLSYACQLRGNRRHLLQMRGKEGKSGRADGEDGAGHYAIRVLVQQLILSLSAVQSTSSPTPSTSTSVVDESSAKTAMDLSLSIIALIQALITEEQEHSEPATPSSSSSPMSTSIPPDSPAYPADASASPSSPAQEQFQALLVSLSSPAVRAHPPLTSSLVSILPSITFGNPSLLHVLYSVFLPHLSFLPHSEVSSDADSRWWVSAFADLSSHIPKASAVGSGIRHFFFEQRLVQRLFDYIQQHRPAVLTPLASPSKEEKTQSHGMTDGPSSCLAEFIELPSLPYTLQLLQGLVYGHPPSQDFCSPLIPLLQQLESIASAKKIGSLSEQLLSSLSVNNDNTLQLLSDLRSSARAEKKQKAAERRQKLLDQMGFKGGDGQHGKLVSGVRVRGMEDVQEEAAGSLRCCICQEGYGFKPLHMLGVYVYVKPIHIRLSSDSALMAGVLGDCDDDEVGVSTVTHLTVIHFRCHQEAVKADKKLKPPKQEWDGAKIRNAHTLCNALLPILLPPSAQDPDGDSSYDVYVQAVEAYWQRFSFAPRLTLPRYLLVLEDLKFLLLRYANEESFSEDSKGGGKESNVGLIVYLMQMAIATLNKAQLGEQGLEQVERMQRRAWKMLQEGKRKDRKKQTTTAGGGGEAGADATDEQDSKADKEEHKQLEEKMAEQPSPDPDADEEEAAPSLTRSGKRRRRKKASPPSKPRARKRQKKGSSSSPSSYSLTNEEQRILDSYRSANSSASASASMSGVLSDDDELQAAVEELSIDFWLSSLVTSLVLNSFDEWKEVRWPCMKRLIALVAQDTPQLAAQRKLETGDGPAGEGGEEEEWEKEDGGEREAMFVSRVVASRPILLFFLLINHIHTLLHDPPFPHTTTPPYPPHTSHWRSPSSSSPSPHLLASRFSFLQLHDYALITHMQGPMLNQLMRHASARHERDDRAECEAEMAELLQLCGTLEQAQAECGTPERMMRRIFTHNAPDAHHKSMEG